MAHLGYTPPSRDEALRRAEWLDDQSVNVGSFMKRMVGGGFSSILNAYRRPDPNQEYLDRQENGIRSAEEITEQEASWLAERIGRDGQLHENEKALIAYMETLGAELPASLVALLPPDAKAS